MGGSSKIEKDQTQALNPSSNPTISIETILPQQADDATVKQKVLILFDQVELHVDNFYHEDAVQLTPEQEGALSKFGTPALSKPLVSLLETATRRNRLIKHCLAFYAVSLVTPSDRSRGLLPYELHAMLSATSLEDAQPKGDPCKPNPQF